MLSVIAEGRSSGGGGYSDSYGSSSRGPSSYDRKLIHLTTLLSTRLFCVLASSCNLFCWASLTVLLSIYRFDASLWCLLMSQNKLTICGLNYNDYQLSTQWQKKFQFSQYWCFNLISFEILTCAPLSSSLVLSPLSLSHIDFFLKHWSVHRILPKYASYYVHLISLFIWFEFHAFSHQEHFRSTWFWKSRYKLWGSII